MSIERKSEAVIEARTDDIDLEEWIFGLSDTDYQACARGHRAAGVFADQRGRGSINVESIGGNLIIQHYRAVRTTSALVEMYSSASRVYLMHLVPVPASVRWRLAVTPVTSTRSKLHCTVEVQLNPVLSAMGRMMALGFFLRRHVEEETKGFASDITRKSLTPQPN